MASLAKEDSKYLILLILLRVTSNLSIDLSAFHTTLQDNVIVCGVLMELTAGFQACFHSLSLCVSLCLYIQIHDVRSVLRGNKVAWLLIFLACVLAFPLLPSCRKAALIPTLMAPLHTR